MKKHIELTQRCSLGTTFVVLFLLTVALIGTSANGQSARVGPASSSTLEAGLAKALGTTDDAGEAIRAYMAEGIINKRPNKRIDYTDYYIVNKPAQFLGHELQIIEQEYMKSYVGCCVSPGTGLTVRLNGSSENLRRFAAQNRCTFEGNVDFQEIMRTFKLAAIPGNYALISCRERDRGAAASVVMPAVPASSQSVVQKTREGKCESADLRQGCPGGQSSAPSRSSAPSSSVSGATPAPPVSSTPPAQGGDLVAAYASNLASQLERASYPACGVFAANLRMLGNSGAPEAVRMRQVESMFGKVPAICLRRQR